MKKSFLVLCAVMMMAVGIAASSKVLPVPKVSLEDAATIARKAATGNVESAELEREGGRLVWTFEIRTSANALMEVVVDANDGTVLTVQNENDDRDDDDDDDEHDDDAKPPRGAAR